MCLLDLNLHLVSERSIIGVNIFKESQTEINVFSIYIKYIISFLTTNINNWYNLEQKFKTADNMKLHFTSRIYSPFFSSYRETYLVELEMSPLLRPHETSGAGFPLTTALKKASLPEGTEQ